jgi:hypothetical protein
MKRLLIAGFLATALTLTAFSQQQASAWCKVNFSAGVNYSFESGGNCLFWGMFKGSDYPGCGYDPGCGYGSSFYNYYQPSSAYPVAYGAPYTPNYAAPYATPAQAPVQQAGYYYPAAYGYNQAPSYWYGR